jgi:hypothetical protein
LWRIGPLLGRDLEAYNGTAAVAVQKRGKHASTTTELLLVNTFPLQRGNRSVVYAVRAEKLTIYIELGQPVNYVTITQPSDHMRYLYQKEKRALTGNLQNRRYSFLPFPQM